MRRILVIPSISRTSAIDDAAYQEFFALSRLVFEAGERAYWYMVMPSWVRDGLFGHDRIGYIYLDSTRDSSLNNVTGFPALELARQFARRGGRHTVDAVLTDCTLFASYLGKLLSDPNRPSMPVVLRMHGDAPIRDIPAEWMMLGASIVCNKVAVRSSKELSMLARLVGNYVNPGMRRLMLENAVSWPMGHDLSKLALVRKDVKRQDRVVMFVGGGFNDHSDKRWLIDLARSVSVSGISEVALTSSSPRYRVERSLPNRDRSFFYSFHTGVRGDAYLREIARYHYFVSSCTETVGPDDLEDEMLRILMGQVGIFPAIPSIRDRLQPDYPFLYNAGNTDEVLTLVDWVVSHYDKAQEMIIPSVKLLTECHDDRKTSLDFWRGMQDIIEERYRVNRLKDRPEGEKQPLFSTVYDVARGLGDEFVLDVFLDVLEEKVTWLKPFGRKGTLKEYGDVAENLPTLYDLREMLDNLGWADQCDGIDIRLKRERDPMEGVLNG